MVSGDYEFIIDYQTYLGYVIAFSGKTKEEAEKIVRDLYIEQHGETPEESQKRRDKAWENGDWGKSIVFFIPLLVRLRTKNETNFGIANL